MSKKNEAQWQVVFNQYLREKRHHGYFELKMAERGKFSFSRIETGQYEGLQATEQNGLVWKLSDQDMRIKPCDTLSLPPLPSYVVIKFIDGFYLIRIKEIVKMRDNGSFGITQEQAKSLAEKIVYV